MERLVDDTPYSHFNIRSVESVPPHKNRRIPEKDGAKVMSTSRQEEILKKGFIKSLIEGKLELKDLAGINIDLDMARQAYLQGVQETTLALIELVKENMATAAKQELLMTAVEAVKAGTDKIEVKQSGYKVDAAGQLVVGVPFLLYELDGKLGYLDWIVMSVPNPAADSHATFLHIYCDDVWVFSQSPLSLNDRFLTNVTPPLYLLKYTADGACGIMITSKFHFTENIKIYANNAFTIQDPVSIKGHIITVPVV